MRWRGEDLLDEMQEEEEEEEEEEEKEEEGQKCVYKRSNNKHSLIYGRQLRNIVNKTFS